MSSFPGFSLSVVLLLSCFALKGDFSLFLPILIRFFGFSFFIFTFAGFGLFSIVLDCFFRVIKNRMTTIAAIIRRIIVIFSPVNKGVSPIVKERWRPVMRRPWTGLWTPRSVWGYGPYRIQTRLHWPYPREVYLCTRLMATHRRRDGTWNGHTMTP